LQQEFVTELATLHGRVNTLEARTADLEAKQFSTTTILAGEVVFAISGVCGDAKSVPSGRVQGSAGTPPLVKSLFADGSSEIPSSQRRAG